MNPDIKLSSLSPWASQPSIDNSTILSAREGSQFRYSDSKYKKFSRHYFRQQKRDRCLWGMILLSVLGTIMVWCLMFWYKFEFMLGNILVASISTMTVSFIVVKICVFDRSLVGEERSIVIYWLCCL